jgi:hypothetical protein
MAVTQMVIMPGYQKIMLLLFAAVTATAYEPRSPPDPYELDFFAKAEKYRKQKGMTLSVMSFCGSYII